MSNMVMKYGIASPWPDRKDRPNGPKARAVNVDDAINNLGRRVSFSIDDALLIAEALSFGSKHERRVAHAVMMNEIAKAKDRLP